jgi:hypothetical protein
MLPVIISSVNLWNICPQPIVANLMTEDEKHSIIHTLETQCTIRGVSTELAIQAGQNTKPAVVPPEYCNSSLTVCPTWTNWSGLQHVTCTCRTLGWLALDPLMSERA